MGLFDVQGHAAARPTYQIGSPLFDKIEIDLHPKYFGKNKVTIETINNSPSNIYVQSATLNGKKLDNCWFYRDELIKGGKLVLIMGDKPNTSWGVDVPPPSMSDEK
jgi:putative alpha-1,2-mannosidase